MKVKEVQMKNLDRNESFLGHFIRKCLDKICQLCKATFFSFHSILQPKFAILLNLPCFFKLNLLKIFQNFVLKDMLQKWQKRKYYVCHAVKHLVQSTTKQSQFS